MLHSTRRRTDEEESQALEWPYDVSYLLPMPSHCHLLVLLFIYYYVQAVLCTQNSIKGDKSKKYRDKQEEAIVKIL